MIGGGTFTATALGLYWAAGRTGLRTALAGGMPVPLPADHRRRSWGWLLLARHIHREIDVACTAVVIHDRFDDRIRTTDH